MGKLGALPITYLCHLSIFYPGNCQLGNFNSLLMKICIAMYQHGAADNRW